MLKNRFMRLLTSILIMVVLLLLAVFVLGMFVPPTEQGRPNNEAKLYLGILILVPCVVGLIYQILCDILNTRVLCGAIGTWIKNVIFFILTAASAALQIVSLVGWATSSDANFYTNTLIAGFSFSSTLTGLAFMIATSSDYDPECLPFLTPISIGAGLVLGLIYAGIATIKQVQTNHDLLAGIGVLFSLAILVVMIIWKIRVDGPFTDFGYADGDYAKTGSFLHDGRSKDGGQGSDNRMGKGAANELDRAMRSIASDFCGTFSAGCGDYLTMKTSYNGSSGSRISFSVFATITLSESTLNSHGTFAHSQVEDLVRKYYSECDRIENAANEALRTVQQYHKGYDKGYYISVHPENPSIRR